MFSAGLKHYGRETSGYYVTVSFANPSAPFAPVTKYLSAHGQLTANLAFAYVYETEELANAAAQGAGLKYAIPVKRYA